MELDGLLNVTITIKNTMLGTMGMSFLQMKKTHRCNYRSMTTTQLRN
jgi:hypothetical protein